jgi:hypothetical protein
MRRGWFWSSVGLVLALGLWLGSGVGLAQRQKAAAPAPVIQYAVKFVCGPSPGNVVAKGTYFTAINVHNPTGVAVSFRKKIAIALPLEKAGRVTNFFNTQLGPDQALEIDCQDIERHADQGGFLKGFVVIQSAVELDVVAVYTVADANQQVETFFAERVPPRRM